MEFDNNKVPSTTTTTGTTTTTVFVVNPAVGFTDSRYQTCCCHVTVCGYVIAAFEALSLFIDLIAVCSVFQSSGGVLAVGLIITLLGALGVGLLVFGLIKERAQFIIPHLIWQVVIIVLLVILAIAICFLAAGAGVVSAALANRASAGVDYGGDTANRQAVATALIGGSVVLAVILILVCIAAVAFQIWFFVVVLRCYQYLKAKAESGGNQGSAVPGYNYATAPLIKQ